MRLRRNFVLITSLALAVSLVAGAALSLAHTKKYESKVTIRFVEGGTGEYTGPDKFAGKVKSEKERCIKGRTVRVFRDSDDVEKIGEAETNKRGRWKLEQPDAEEGDYFARAKREFLKREEGHRHVCRKAQSKTITVTGEYEYTGPES